MSTPDSPTRSWAAHFGLPADGTPAEVTAALLRALPGEQFTPREDVAAAANALAGTGLPVSAGAAEVAAAVLAAEVKGFAAAFWSLSPAERRARWVGLSARCRDDAPKHRLAAMEPGLDIEVKPHPDPAVEELAEFVRGLFVLPPRGAAVRQAKWLAARAARYEELVAAAERLRADDPATAALPLPALGGLTRAGTPLTAVEGAAVSCDEEERLRRATAEYRRRLAEAQPRPRLNEGGPGWRPTWVFVVIGIFVLRALASLSSPSTTAPPPTYHTPNPPQYSPGSLPKKLPQVNSLITYPPEELERFREYDRLRAEGKATDRPAPQGYYQWVMQGKPSPIVPVPPGPTAPTSRR